MALSYSPFDRSPKNGEDLLYEVDCDLDAKGLTAHEDCVFFVLIASLTVYSASSSGASSAGFSLALSFLLLTRPGLPPP